MPTVLLSSWTCSSGHQARPLPTTHELGSISTKRPERLRHEHIGQFRTATHVIQYCLASHDDSPHAAPILNLDLLPIPHQPLSRTSWPAVDRPSRLNRVERVRGHPRLGHGDLRNRDPALNTDRRSTRCSCRFEPAEVGEHRPLAGSNACSLAAY